MSKNRRLLIGALPQLLATPPSSQPEIQPGDRIMFQHDPMLRQVEHLLTVYELEMAEKLRRLRQPQVLPLLEPLPVPITHERVRPILPVQAAAYHPPEPVERKPKAERKAIRRRNRKKGQR